MATQVRLAGSHGGRIVLHLASLLRDHKFSWHLRGILREFPHQYHIHQHA